MANNNTDTPDKTYIGVRVETPLFTIIEQLRIEEDRNLSNMVERLLKTHPRIQPLLEAETATASA